MAVAGKANPAAAVARLLGESAHRVMAVCERCVHIALGLADFSDVRTLALDEPSRARGHDYVTLAADASKRRVLFATAGRDAATIKERAAYLDDHGCLSRQIDSVRIDMPAAYRTLVHSLDIGSMMDLDATDL